MKIVSLAVMKNAWNMMRMMSILLLLALVFLGSSCTRLNLQAAKALSTTGQNVATQAQNAASVSDDEIRRAQESEAFQHGYTGTTQTAQYKEIVSLLQDITQELNQRAQVFRKLADLYEAFGVLASMDYGAQTEKALGDLGAAIDGYATAIKQPLPQISSATGILSSIGGIIASRVQQAKVKAASKQIRARDEAFLNLMSNPLVRKQFTDFKKFCLSEWSVALKILWNLDIYNPKPLLDDIGAPAGLVSRDGAAELVKSNPNLKAALSGILQSRLDTQGKLIEQIYDASLDALKGLIAQHKQLEQGTPVDLARLRAIADQLQSLASQLGGMIKAKTVSK